MERAALNHNLERIMSKPEPLPSAASLKAYVPGLSIAEIMERHKLDNVIKLASNENPLGASPLVQEAVRRSAGLAFRYPQGGNPRLRRALAALHGISPEAVAIGNGSDEIIDLLIRMLARPGEHSIVCFKPCFSIYPIQAAFHGLDVKRVPLKEDFSFPLDQLLKAADHSTRLVFVTSPDNPSGFCPPASALRSLAEGLARRSPKALLVIDEAYMDFADNEMESSLLCQRYFPDNTAYLRTFSKSWGMAGLRLGYGILPKDLADAFWRARLPFSVNILAEEAALAALADKAFREKTLSVTREGRKLLSDGLRGLGFRVWPSSANFVMAAPPQGGPSALAIAEELLKKGVIIRSLKSYELPDLLRISVGTPHENRSFLCALKEILERAPSP